MAMQIQNDKEVASCVRAKAQHEWDKFVIIVKQCPPLLKPILVKVTSEQLLQVLSLNAWGMGSVFQDATSRMEKDENLQKMIRSTHSTYARRLKMAWDVKNWD